VAVLSLTSFDTLDLPYRTADVVVVGSGAAGLSCAITLEELGLDVIVITKTTPNESSTELAQGGIAVALPREDSPELHFSDTMRAGAGLVNPKMARILTEEGVKRVIELLRWGAQFERDENGLLKFTKEAAHSVPRIVYYRDETGKELHRTLLESFKGKIITGCRALELLVREGRCYGLLVEREGRRELLYAPIVVLATGGAAGLYLKNTNPPTSTGDGISLALRWGAELQDLEFVQFHPTAFCDGEECFLISEAVRGEGAILVDRHGRRFMGDYHHLWELAPRDVVTRAIESQKELTGGEVYLDFRPIEERGIDIYERFPYITKRLLEKGIDPKREPVPITPVAHYYIGGVKVDTFGRSSIEGLFAVGETSCTGVHGANRLASNSLLECIVFGNRAAYGAYRDFMYLSKDFKEIRLSASAFPSKNASSYTLYEVKKIMWENVGIVRSAEKLTYAIERLSEIALSSSSWEVRSCATLALAVAVSAMRREESRGGHYRSDFPYEREEFRKHSSFTLEDLKRLFTVEKGAGGL
jgi:L-aspartate oxidase